MSAAPSDRIPASTMESLRAYIETGRPTGGFLRAVLSNDLRESFGRADVNNRAAMFEIVSYLYNDAPGTCWGSPERVNEWMKHRGLEARP